MQRRQEELFGGRRGMGYGDDSDDNAGEGDVFLQRQEHERKQDEHLDVIGATLARVSQMAEGFGQELRQQNDLLDEVGRDMEATNSTMKIVENKTQELVEKAGGPGWFCLTVILSAIAFVLFMMIIYT